MRRSCRFRGARCYCFFVLQVINVLHGGARGLRPAWEPDVGGEGEDSEASGGQEAASDAPNWYRSFRDERTEHNNGHKYNEIGTTLLLVLLLLTPATPSMHAGIEGNGRINLSMYH